ncbi:MAG: hypothetical protein JO323_21055 [Acidobacteriia bacterium]|nr:hypothetical protein [Terriglobia bacterium]
MTALPGNVTVHRAAVDVQQRARIAALASDFPRLWQKSQHTGPGEETRGPSVAGRRNPYARQAHRRSCSVQWRRDETLDLPRPLTAWELRTTPAEIVAEVDRLTDDYTDKQIVEILNRRGTLSGCGQRFNSRIIARLRREYQLKPRYDRLREKGLLTLEEMSALLDIGPKCVITWRNHGLLRGYPLNDRDDWL